MRLSTNPLALLLSHDDGPLQRCTVGQGGQNAGFDSSHNPPHSYKRDIVPEWPRRSRPPVQRKIRSDDETNDWSTNAAWDLPFGFCNSDRCRRYYGLAVSWRGSEGDGESLGSISDLVGALSNGRPSTAVDGIAAAMVTSADLAQQIKPVALDLAIVRHGVDQLATTIKQLAAKAEEMTERLRRCRQPSRISKKRLPPQLSLARPPRARRRNRRVSTDHNQFRGAHSHTGRSRSVYAIVRKTVPGVELTDDQYIF